MINWKFFAGLLVVAGLFGCGQKDNSKSDEEEESVSTILPTEEVMIRTEKLLTQEFKHELVSNGRIGSQQIAELRFVSTAGGNVPVKIFVQNGAHVAAGDAIAMLDTFLLSNSYSQATVNLQRAYLDLQDVLLGRGYRIVDLASIPEEDFKLAAVKSGYENAKTQHDLAKYHLENAILRTPIAGMVTNLFAKPYCAINTSEPFCTIINEGKPEIDFKILENELPLIRKGDKVKVQSFSSPDIEAEGSIVDINPSVDVEGMVRVKAFIQPNALLFNGMNVRISAYRSFGRQWVVPKSAVVLRTGKQVVFVYRNGKAAWNYVTTGLENATHVTITSDTLHEGDEIIISGNEYLADDTKVKLVGEAPSNSPQGGEE